MIKIKDYEIKNSFKEWTVGEFEEISIALNNEKLDNIDKYLEIFRLSGISEDVLETITYDEFVDIITNFLSNDLENKYIREIEVGGYKYIAYKGDDFVLGIKDLAKIESIVKSDKKWISKTMAILFKREDLSRNEHYEKSHIEYKAKLFNELSSDIIMPYIIHITDKLGKKLVYMNENTIA